MTSTNSKTINLTGQKFNHLLVLKVSEKKSKSGAMWECVCDCGKRTHVASFKLRSGAIKSCGCYRKELLTNLKHGYARGKDRTYRTWKEMRQRCNNPNSDKWKWYGGRGISICARWEDFSKFLKDMGHRPEGHTLDRINSDGNYEPCNCRWATPKQQAETNRGCFKPGRIPHNKGVSR